MSVPADDMAATGAAESKKKRRQNVACDPCKFRRVRCDLTALLQALPSSSTDAADADPPLRILVRRNPGVSCTHCRNKGLKCTTEQIVNPTKPNKGGRRIEEAKKLFGGDEDEQEPLHVAEFNGQTMSAGAGPSMTMWPDTKQYSEQSLFGQGQMWDGMQEQGGSSSRQSISSAPVMTPLDAHFESEQYALGQRSPGGASSRQSFSAPSMSLFDAEVQYMLQDTAFMLGTGNPPSPAMNKPPDMFSSVPQPAPSGVSWESFLSIPSNTPSASIAPIPPSAKEDDGADGSPEEMERLSQDVWHRFGQLDDPQIQQAIALKHQQRPLPRKQTSGSDLEGHVPASLSSSSEPAMERIRDRWVPDNWDVVVNPFPNLSATQSSSQLPDTPRAAGLDGRLPVAVPQELYPHPPAGPRSRPLPAWGPHRLEDAQAVLAYHAPPSQRKRPEVPYMIVSSDSFDAGHPMTDTVALGHIIRQRDPNHLWLPKGQQGMIMWGRRDEIQQGLADRSIGLELSRTLVNTFFQAAHLSLPTISPESFYIDWHRADQRPDLMSPEQETLCAIIEAWGARYSDHPVILGLQPDKHGHAPKVITPAGNFVPGTPARAYWGRARLSACNALIARARNLIDINGILRRPTITGLQALTIYNQLIQMQDQKKDLQEQWMENQMMHSAIIDQMKLLQLMWDSPAPPMITAEVTGDTMMTLRIKQRRLFWTTIITDAFWAAGASREPRVSDESIETASSWLDAVWDKMPASAFRTIALTMKLYLRLTLVGRSVARELSVPNHRKGGVDVDRFCKKVKELWHDLKMISSDINNQLPDELESATQNLPGFSPVNSVANLRLSIPFLFLVIHQIIRDQLAFRKDLKESSVVDTAHITPFRPEPASASGSPSGTSPQTANIETLEALSLQSVDILLQTCRAQVDLFAALLPTGLLQTASIFMRVLIATAQFLSEVPTVEQGYPADTLGGYEWTWSAKQKALQVCIDGLYQLGWAWADVDSVLEGVVLSMERMTPSPEQIQQWENAQTQSSPSDKIKAHKLGIKVEQEKQEGDHAIEVAMRFWPPRSVPETMEDAMKQLDISRNDAPDAMRMLKGADNRRISAPKSNFSPGYGPTAPPSTGGVPSGGAMSLPDFDWSALEQVGDRGLGDVQSPMDLGFDMDALLNSADMTQEMGSDVFGNPSSGNDALRDFESFLQQL